MWYFAIALVFGVVLGALLPLSIPLVWARYLAVVLLAALDAAFGGIRASLEDRFDFPVFASGFFVNGILAAGLTYIGDRLGVELYYAALFAFGYRIFLNLGVIRRQILTQWRKRRAARQGNPSI
ncbi:MAG: small basic family protein [Thermaerobacter sp.]|nr:small basic family protein [Thermaerobacter sp.]